MPMFDYKGEDGRELMAEIYGLSTYGSATAYFFQVGLRASQIEAFAPPPGWRDLTPEELGLSNDRLDILGNYKGEPPYGVNVLGAQAKVLGKFDENGTLLKTAISYAGTSNATDLLDYYSMVKGGYIHQFDYLLDALADYTTANGLDGSDVYVTGYSLGAGAANNMHAAKDGSWDGFYADSQYMAAAVPVISDGDTIINFGFENDVVHRAAGHGSDVEIIDGALNGNDKQYANSTDNVVLYDDLYALPTWPQGKFALLNLSDWYAHLGGTIINPIETIGSSRFYEVIEQDSAVIIANLSDPLRNTLWVSDKQTVTSDHYMAPSFVLGTDKADKIADGPSDDFLEGFGGDDRFRVGRGFDTVDGGDDNDTVEMSGWIGNYNFIRLENGTVFAQAKSGFQGVDEFIDIEYLSFSRFNFLGIKLFTSTFGVEEAGLRAGGWTIAYADHEEGTSGDDTLTGDGGIDRLFGLDGDDTLHGMANQDLLHGGHGNDTLYGGPGIDILMGGFGDDVLIGGAHNDTLDGGTGSDIFDFVDGPIGNDHIVDFNVHENGHDVLRFSSADFADADAVLAAAFQKGSDTVIQVAGGSVTLDFFDVDDLSASDIVIV